MRERPVRCRARAFRALFMAESIGAIPFSVGGTNASGYSLVAAFSLAKDNAYTISTADYDFGIVLSGVTHTWLLVTPVLFSNTLQNTLLFHIDPDNNSIATSGNLEVSASSVTLTSYYASSYISVSLFKFA